MDTQKYNTRQEGLQEALDICLEVYKRKDGNLATDMITFHVISEIMDEISLRLNYDGRGTKVKR
jgi:hypothetical protein